MREQRLRGRVAVVTGAGRGIGREEALLLAAQGARVVVNDLGTDWTGEGSSSEPAEEVVKEILARGGEAVSNGADVSDWEGAKALIDQAVSEFGGLDILICNAGILRNRMLMRMSEAEWDDVIRVNLKGHFCPTRWAASYWRDNPLGERMHTSPRRILFTSSGAGLHGLSPGVANYVAAKAAVLSLGISLSKELAPIGATVNVLSPRALTRISENVLGADDFIDLSPRSVAEWAVYLCTDEAREENGQVFAVGGSSIERYSGWRPLAGVSRTRLDDFEEVFELAGALK